MIVISASSDLSGSFIWWHGYLTSLNVLQKKKANAGVLTNFEVLDFLRYRGAAKDPTWVIAPIAASEFKVGNGSWLCFYWIK